VGLAHLPTPLEEMVRLRQALGASPRLLIKRDDLTGLATGGNKTRKLEFVGADALVQGADTLVTAGGSQSNHCRQTAAAAARLGLDCVLLLSGEPQPRSTWQANLLLDALLGAEVRWIGEQDRAAALRETGQALEREGRRPYLIPVGASVPLGAVGYVAAVEELTSQLAEQQLRVDRILIRSGSAGTQAGLLVGLKGLGLKIGVEGICGGPYGTELQQAIRELAAETAAYLGLDLTVADAEIIVHGRYGQAGYGVITPAEQEAIRLLARTEGILTDPVYSGRALVGLIDLIRRGHYRPDETILFWHTGGTAGLFARADELLA
jgi:D-cysteine desulfhydrase family pyridoxal phosphate-dependent enzyme